MVAMRRIAAGAALIGALTVGLGYVYSRENPASTFITAPVERGSIASAVTATGTVEAVMTVDVSSQLSGRVADVFVTFNDTVTAGQALAQLDREIYGARVNEAKAALKVAEAMAHVQQAALERAGVAIANAGSAQKMAEAQAAAAQAKQGEAEKELQRKLELARSGFVADRELSQVRALRDGGAADLRASLEQVAMKTEAIAIAEAERRMAEANLQNAEAVVEQKQATLEGAALDLERTVLRAPIAGIIIKRDVNAGQTVAVSLEAKTLFKIANDLREMQVLGKIDEADVGRVRPGQVASFTVDAYPDRVFTGRVLQIRKSPEVVQGVVTYTTILSTPNPELLLLPGMTATLRIVVSDTGDTLKIPSQALRFRLGGPSASGHPAAPDVKRSEGAPATVWLLGAEGHPTPISIVIGRNDDNSTQLLEGALTEGQPLIVGVSNPRDGTSFSGIRLGF